MVDKATVRLSGQPREMRSLSVAERKSSPWCFPAKGHHVRPSKSGARTQQKYISCDCARHIFLLRG